MKKIKLANKIIGVYLVGHSIIAISMIAIVGIGLNIMKQNLIQTYKINAEQYIEYFDQEMIDLKKLLMYTMQNKNILILANEYNQLSNYNKINYQKQAKSDLLTMYGQYKWVNDIGIYLSQQNLWITAIDWFRVNEKVNSLKENSGIYMIDKDLYLVETYKYKEQIIKGYIKLNNQELIKLMEKMRFNEEINIEVYFENNLLQNLSKIGEQNNTSFYKIYITSKLYPIKFCIYIDNKLLSFGNDFYILSIFSLILFMIITFRFSRYLNVVIHRPLQNIVNQIEYINCNNLKEEIIHEGIDEFEYVTESFNRTKNLLEMYIKKNYEQEIHMKQMELSHLQGQVKPHFLYNCFFNISNMCKTYDVEKIEQMTQRLAKYYRYITRTNHQVVTLKEEYEHMKNYIEIQQIRFGERVRVVMDLLPEEYADINVPRLILQPIVENAYKYVFEKIESEGNLRIKINQDKEFLLIIVEDNGDFIKLKEIEQLMKKIESEDQPITGLINIKKRLNYTNGKNDIKITQSELGGLSVIIEILVKS